jgi:hypothetical protein
MWNEFGNNLGECILYAKTNNICIMHSGLKSIALQLCTCTWIEIMTGAGITLYLLYLNSYMLAAITASVFAPLIRFHFIMTRISEPEDYCNKSRCLSSNLS